MKMLAQAFTDKPFVTPLPIWDWWMILLIPLLFGIALTWKAMKSPSLKEFPRQTIVLFGKFVFGFALAAVIVYAIVEWV